MGRRWELVNHQWSVVSGYDLMWGTWSQADEKKTQRNLTLIAVCIALAAATPMSYGQATYSWYQCIQRCTLQLDDCGFQANWRVTSCHFRNVCINTETKNIVFFLDPFNNATVHTDEFYNNQTGFPSPLAWLQAGNESPTDEEELQVWVELRDEEFPREPVDLEERENSSSQQPFFLPSPVVYMEPFTPSNFGHCIADNAFPAFRLLRRFGLLDEPATVLFKSFDYGHEILWNSLSGKNLLSLFNPIITRSPMLTVGMGPLEPNNTRLVCSRDLVVGFGKLGMYTDSEVWDLFNVRLLKAQGLSPLRVPQKHKIVIFKKTGRRSMLNVFEVADHLADVFDVRVQVVDIAKMPLKKQAQIVNSATVVVSPCGGLSFSSLYLPKHAAAIFVCTWDPQAKLQLQIERFWYDRQSRFHAIYYPVDEFEITINTTFVVKGAGRDHELDEQSLYRNFADVRVSLTKMVKVVHSALHKVELSLGWDLSYTVPGSNL